MQKTLVCLQVLGKHLDKFSTLRYNCTGKTDWVFLHLCVTLPHGSIANTEGSMQRP